MKSRARRRCASRQKALPREIVERVVVGPNGKVIRVELLPPFSYLHQVSDRVGGEKGCNDGAGKTKTSMTAGTCLTNSLQVDLRATGLYTRHKHNFELPAYNSTKQLFTDKAALRKCVLELRAQGKSYREIGREVGLHWTRVGQIVKSTR